METALMIEAAIVRVDRALAPTQREAAPGRQALTQRQSATGKPWQRLHQECTYNVRALPFE